MRTSNRRAPARKLLGAAVGGICCLVLVNMVLTFALLPYGTHTQVVWWAWNQARDEKVDTVFVGSSLAMAAFSPQELDSALGSSSFNLATSAQMLENSKASVEAAVRDHGIKRVVIGLSYGTLAMKPYMESAATFAEAKASYEAPLDALRTWSRVLLDQQFRGTSYSISGLFPWTYSHVGFTPDAVKKNIALRLSGATPLEAGESTNPGWVYSGRGYYHADAAIDPTAINIARRAADEKRLQSSNVDDLLDLCDYCRDRGVSLYVVLTPQVDAEVLSYGGAYPKNMELLRSEVERRGATFIDANMAKAGAYERRYAEFNDAEHLNATGAARFTGFLAREVARVEAGERIDGDFYGYDDWDAYRASLDGVASVALSLRAHEGYVELRASSLQGSGVDVEYEFSHLDPTSNQYKVIRGFGPSSTHRVPVGGHGAAVYRVVARPVGSTDPAAVRSMSLGVSY